MSEMQRYQSLEREREVLRQESAEALFVKERQHNEESQNLRAEFDRKFFDQEAVIRQLELELEDMKRDFEEQIKQQEEEWESEMAVEQGTLAALCAVLVVGDISLFRERSTRNATNP